MPTIMAKYRLINTHFWDDAYIRTLNDKEKLLFLYLISNPLASICGVYEIALDRVAFDTGIPLKSVQSILEKFEQAEKIKYVNGWVLIRNFTKHQVSNASVVKGISRAIAELPHSVHTLYTEWVQSGYSVAVTKPNLTKLNLTKPIGGDARARGALTPSQEASDFFTNVERQQKAIAYLAAKGVPEELVKQELVKFISYWTERNKSGTKVRWQLEKTFEVGRRLATWFRNIKPERSAAHKQPVVFNIQD